MMIKVNSEFLDFDGDIENVRQSKLFEEIENTVGDFSYSFDIPYTSKNLRILTFPLADVSSKRVYRLMECELIDDDGLPLYKGSLRVEKTNKVFKCSFFSGNSNWISLLSGKISDLDFSEYDTIINKTNIENSWTLTEGVKFPFLDTGNLLTRSHNHTVVEDWSPSIFVKTIFNKIFERQGIKIQGELLSCPQFQGLLVSTNTKDQAEIENNTALIGKTTPQSVDGEVLTFDDDTNYPFHNTVDNSFDTVTSAFTSTITARYKIEVSLFLNYILFPTIILRKNGVNYRSFEIHSGTNYNMSTYLNLNIGDYFDFVISIPSFGSAVFYSGSIKITPFFIYDVKGSAVVPKWTQQDFVRSVVSVFNPVIDFEPVSKTITFNLFDNVKSKPSIDISNHVTVYDIDYVEFVSNYAKNNYFSYKSTDAEELKKYNVKNFLEYGKGNIQIDNAHLPQSKDVLKSELASPVSYINRQFGNVSLERLVLLQLTESDSLDITSITDNGGIARFNVSDTIIQVGYLVRIETDDENLSFDGEWVVSAVGSNYFEIGDIPYTVNDTGKVTILITATSSSDDVFLLLDTGLQTYSDMSTITDLYIDNDLYTETSTAFFNLLNTGLPITEKFKHSLSFGSIDNLLSYQWNLLDIFWNSFRLIMNDPAKIFVEAYLPKSTYLNLSPLNPVFVKTLETTNEYYINKTTGYKNSSEPCIMELIKL